MTENTENTDQTAAGRRWTLWNFIMRAGSVLCLQSVTEDQWLWYAFLRDGDTDLDAPSEAPGNLHFGFALPWEGDRDGGLVICRYYGVTLTAATPELFHLLGTALDRIRTQGYELGGKRHSASSPELLTATRPDEVPGLTDAVRSLSPQVAPPAVSSPPRKSNRKALLPWTDGLFPVPNIGNHGTRHLGMLVAGAGSWTDAPDGNALLGALDGRGVVGMVELTDGEDGARRIIDALGPRTLKTLVGVSRLLYERTHGRPVNVAATVSVREVALAIGYKPDRWRKIERETLEAIGRELRALSRIMTFAADGEYDPRRKGRPSGWIAPLLNITAVHVEQDTADGDRIPYEFDAMLGRPWAQAVQERFDVMQVAPGFMDLGEQEICLAWFYLTEFRYRKNRAGQAVTFPIRTLCREARLTVDKLQVRRFLKRLEQWHARLVEAGVLAGYECAPDPESDIAPRDIFEIGAYTVTPAAAILNAYARRQQIDAPQRSHRRGAGGKTQERDAKPPF